MGSDPRRTDPGGWVVPRVRGAHPAPVFGCNFGSEPAVGRCYTSRTTVPSSVLRLAFWMVSRQAAAHTASKARSSFWSAGWTPLPAAACQITPYAASGALRTRRRPDTYPPRIIEPPPVVVDVVRSADQPVRCWLPRNAKDLANDLREALLTGEAGARGGRGDYSRRPSPQWLKNPSRQPALLPINRRAGHAVQTEDRRPRRPNFRHGGRGRRACPRDHAKAAGM